MTAEQVILQNASGTLQSYTPTNGMSVIRSSNFIEGALGVGQGWIIKGDGTAQFDAASIRGTLSANSIFIDAYNRWARNSANSASNLEFVVGNATNQLYWNPTGGTGSGSLLKVGNSTNYMQWDNNTLTVTGAITTNATIQSSTAGGLTIGTSSLQFGAGGYQSSVMFVGAHTAGGVTANKFSLGDKLYFDGTDLTVAGTIIASGGTFSGTITATGTISGGNLTGANIQNTAIGITPTFKVDTSGNVFANNIYATGITTDLGLQIRADGKDSNNNPVAGASSGAIWILSASGKDTKIGNLDGSLNIRYRGASTGIPRAVIIEPRYWTGSTWSQDINMEINLSDETGTQYALYLNNDMVFRGGALTGSGNDVFSDTPTTTTADPNTTAGVAMWRTVNAKGTYVLARSTTSSSIKIKENVSTVTSEEALSLVKNLIPKKFTYKKEEKFDNDFSYKFKQLDYDYGFIAEDIKEKIPTLAIYDLTKEGIEKFKEQSFEEKDIDSEEYFNVVNYKRTAITSILVATVQNLLSRIESLESQLAAQ
jgi:hypothetical protein